MAWFFTSDTHFGHANIIRYCKRPFDSVDEMNDTIIERWNASVKPTDTIFHLGDFALGHWEFHEEYLKALNGYKILVKGNHDRRMSRAAKARFDEVVDYFRLTLDEQTYILSHYPIDDWEDRYKGSIMLHGHAHNRGPIMKNRVDVGVDGWGFRPITTDDILGVA